MIMIIMKSNVKYVFQNNMPKYMALTICDFGHNTHFIHRGITLFSHEYKLSL